MKNVEEMEQMHLNCLKGIYFSQIIDHDYYTIAFSDLIEDAYYNYCAFLRFSDVSFETEWDEIKKIFPNDRTPCLYVTPSSDLYGKESVYISNFKKNYTDAWMVLQERQYLNTLYISPEINVSIVDSKENFDTFVKVFTCAYGGDDPKDPYGQLPQTYTKSLQNSWNNNGLYSITHYLAEWKGKPAGVATAIRHNNLVAIYNVGTISNYRHKGVGETIMSSIVGDLKQNETLFLQTEKGSHVEAWYRKMGFETLFLGTCYSEK